MLKLLNTKTQKYSAALMTGAYMGISNTAFARNDLDAYLSSTTGRVNQIPDLVSFLCYVGGACLAGLGVVKLKQHVENPGNNPMKDGLARLGFGGMLLAIPTITDVMQDTATSSSEARNIGFGSDPTLTGSGGPGY